MNRKASNRRRIVTIIAAVAILLMSASLTLVYAGNGDPGVVPPQSIVYGKSYADWSIAWFKWALSIPYSNNPIFDTTGANCGVGQSGPMWFLAGAYFGVKSLTRDCTIPAGKYVFFPLINVINDYPCPDPNFQPSPGQSLEDFLTNGNDIFWGARQYIDAVKTLKVTVDGNRLQNPFDYRATSPMFIFKGDPSLTATFDPCITGTPQHGVSDGYWVMLAPLSAGTHTLFFYANGLWREDVTYHLTVTP